jgi:hypothetical protein
MADWLNTASRKPTWNEDSVPNTAVSHADGAEARDIRFEQTPPLVLAVWAEKNDSNLLFVQLFITRSGSFDTSRESLHKAR